MRAGVWADAAILEISLEVSQKEIDQTCDPAISWLDIPKDFMSHDRETFTPMFTAVFIAIARKWINLDSHK